jgi:CelD/BcsL family acetyltransferase involved in cellulose biosynthesis
VRGAVAAAAVARVAVVVVRVLVGMVRQHVGVLVLVLQHHHRLRHVRLVGKDVCNTKKLTILSINEYTAKSI